MPDGHRWRRVAGTALAAALAACGTGGGEELDVAALIADDPVATTVAAEGVGAAPAPTDGDVVIDPVTGVASPRPGRPGPGAPGNPTQDGALADATAPGAQASPAAPVAGEPIRIGVHYSEDLQAAYTALGASDAEPDVDESVRLVIDHLNAHGGIGGRPVEAVFHGSNPLDGTFDAQSQAACEDFADHDVLAVVSGAVMPSLVLPDCLHGRGIPYVWNYHYLVDEPTWQQYRDNLYMPFSINADRLAGVYVDGLARAGYFEGARIGIVRYDNPQHDRFTSELLRPALAAAGADVVEEVALSQPPSAAAAGDTVTQISGAMLRLRSRGATHVLFVPTGGAVPFLFMAEAEGQGYRPRYAMNTLDIPYFVSDQAGASQLHGAVAVGWSPGSDVYREDEPMSPPRELCYGLTNSKAAQRFCDALFFLDAALERAPSFDAAGLRTGVERLGTDFDPVFSLGTTFGPGRHDGADTVTLVAYVDECECFRYSGPRWSIG